MVANVGGCPLGVCIINGEVVFFDLPYYIGKVITVSSEDSRPTQRPADLPKAGKKQEPPSTQLGG